MTAPQKNGVKNSSTRIATITTGLESLSLLIPNDVFKRVMIVLSPAISYCVFIGIRFLYKRYVCKKTIHLFLSHIKDAEYELSLSITSTPRKHTLENDILGYKRDIKMLQKDMIMVEFK